MGNLFILLLYFVGPEDLVESIASEEYGGDKEFYGKDFEEEYEGDDGTVAQPPGSGGAGKRGDTEARNITKGGIHFGEPERQTLLNLIETLDAHQILLSKGMRSKPDLMVAKKELWQQILSAFNELTGRDSSLLKLQRLFDRMKSGTLHKKYLEYDQSLERWIFYPNGIASS